MLPKMLTFVFLAVVFADFDFKCVEKYIRNETLIQLKSDPSKFNNFLVGVVAAKCNRTDLEELLKDERVDPTVSKNFAIAWASTSNNVHNVKALLNWTGLDGLKVDPTDNDHFAMFSKSFLVKETLLGAGNFSACSVSSCTPKALSSMIESDCCRLLYKVVNEVNITTPDLQLALSNATYMNNFEAFKILLEVARRRSSFANEIELSKLPIERSILDRFKNRTWYRSEFNDDFVLSDYIFTLIKVLNANFSNEDFEQFEITHSRNNLAAHIAIEFGYSIKGFNYSERHQVHAKENGN